jgi:restriction system protein
MNSSQIEFTMWFGPLLDALRKLGGSGRPKEVIDQIAKDQSIPDEVLEQTMKSGLLRFANQVAWARQYLVWEGLLKDNTRGVWTLTESGATAILSIEDAKIIAKKWFTQFAKNKKERPATKTIENAVEILPHDETIAELATPEESAVVNSTNLLDVLQSVTPIGFENICQRLLREHGFEDVHVTQASHDGGIDGYGTLELNPFVSIKVLFQCKRYKGTVSRAQVGDFRNAMIGRAEKGIIITTGIFSEDAKREAIREGAPPIELIDGQKLVSLFESVQLGVKQRTVFDVDLAFFQPYMDKPGLLEV